MKLVFILFITLFLTNCSLNKDSKYWTEDFTKKTEDQKKLTEKHLIHRINYNNSYVACFNENDHEAFVGFICNKCSTIEEKTQEPVKEITKKFGLSKNHISQTNLEIVGTCQNCL